MKLVDLESVHMQYLAAPAMVKSHSASNSPVTANTARVKHRKKKHKKQERQQHSRENILQPEQEQELGHGVGNGNENIESAQQELGKLFSFLSKSHIRTAI